MVDRHFTLKISQLGYMELCCELLKRDNAKTRYRRRDFSNTANVVTGVPIYNAFIDVQDVDISDAGLLLYEILSLSPVENLTGGIIAGENKPLSNLRKPNKSSCANKM